jgi:hypothetical protein
MRRTEFRITVQWGRIPMGQLREQSSTQEDLDSAGEGAPNHDAVNWRGRGTERQHRCYAERRAEAHRRPTEQGEGLGVEGTTVGTVNAARRGDDTQQ